MNLLEQWHVQEHGCRNAPPVVFLHGFMGRGDDWLPVIALLGTTFRCITLDLPGHGRNEIDAGGAFPAVLADLVQIGEQLGLHDAGLVGYSMGGRVALAWALAAQARFAALALESAQPGIAEAEARAERLTWDLALSARLESVADDADAFRAFLDDWYAMPLFQSLGTRPDLLAPLIETRRENDPIQLARATALLGAGSLPAVWSALPTLAPPALCIVGANDRKYCRIAEEMSQRGARIAVQCLENCGHNVHLENPEGYTTVLRCFLEAALRPGA